MKKFAKSQGVKPRLFETERSLARRVADKMWREGPFKELTKAVAVSKSIEPERRYCVRESFIDTPEWSIYPGGLWIFLYNDGTIERIGRVRVRRES